MATGGAFLARIQVRGADMPCSNSSTRQAETRQTLVNAADYVWQARLTDRDPADREGPDRQSGKGLKFEGASVAICREGGARPASSSEREEIDPPPSRLPGSFLVDCSARDSGRDLHLIYT